MVMFLGVWGPFPLLWLLSTDRVMFGRMLSCRGEDEQTFSRGMAAGEFSALYPLQAVEIAPFVSLSLFYHTVASQLLHAWADAA